MNAKIFVFVICVEAIIYLLLYNLHDCTFNPEILKAIITRARLRTCSLKKRTDENIQLCCKQRNVCIIAMKSERRLLYKFK